jgi:hypothetical protein
VKSPSNASNNVHRLFPQVANENARFSERALAVSLAEGAHAGDRPALVLPPPYQATDSTMRGYLQALGPDPLLWPLTVMM